MLSQRLFLFCKLITFRFLEAGQFKEKYLVKVIHTYGKKTPKIMEVERENCSLGRSTLVDTSITLPTSGESLHEYLQVPSLAKVSFYMPEPSTLWGGIMCHTGPVSNSAQ